MQRVHRPGRIRTRAGTALILALVLLTALLLLGLPFLVSQSSSVSGSQAYATDRSAWTARDSAEHLAVACAALAMQPAQAAPPPSATWAGAAWTALPATLDALHIGAPPVALTVPLASVPEAGDGSVALDAAYLARLGIGPQPGPTAIAPTTRYAASISDESGRLDPNDLSAVAWGRLLAALHIPDWTDHAVYPDPGPAPPGGFPAGTEVPSADGLGQLAKTLAVVRMALPGGRITDLAQLLAANPQLPPTTVGVCGGPCTGPFAKLRWPLTRAELARLAPVLTVCAPAPGRRGLIDLGTVVATEASGTVWLDRTPDSDELLIGVGTHVLGSQPAAPAGASACALAIGAAPTAVPAGAPVLLGTPLQMLLQPLALQGGAAWCSPGDALLIEQAPPVNVHQCAPIVRAALGTAQVPLPVPADGAVITTVGGLWSAACRATAGSPVATMNLASWLAPLGTGAELSTLALSSPGIMRIAGSAATVDASGHLVRVVTAEHIMQAVPQELLLERHWLTQGDDEALVDARWTSHLESWPQAVRRAALPPDDHDLSPGHEALAAIPPLTGLRPRPLPSEAVAQPRGPGGSPSASGLTWPLEQEPIDWRVPFGAWTPESAQSFALSETLATTGAITRAPPLAAASLPPATQCLRPDGFFHAPSTVLAYPLTWAGTAAALTQSALFLPRPGSQELGARQFGLWVRPEQDWTSGLHPLLSVRTPAAMAGVRLDGSGGNTACEGWLQLTVDATRGLLVLAIAPPTVESIGDAGPLIDSAVPGDALLDHTCLCDLGVGALAPLAPDPYADHADPAVTSSLAAFTGAFARNRVLHCYATPASASGPFWHKGQWYHIQVAMASDRPDGVALIIDGCCGQDTARLAAGPRLSVVGDTFTLPGLALAQTLPAVAAGDWAGLQQAAIAVAAPPPMDAHAMLPSAGIVRIDDEYIRYAAIAADGRALLGCQRGARQDTDVAAADPAQAQPITQAHAAGSLVSPGGYHLALSATAPAGARLYRGGCALSDGMPIGDPACPGHPGAVWVGVAAGGPGGGLLPPTLTSIPVDPTHGDWAAFPNSGVVILNGVALLYAAKGPAALLGVAALGAGTPGWTLTPGGSVPVPGIHATGLVVHQDDPVLLASAQLTGPDPLQDGRYELSAARPGSAFLLALEDPAGSTEWVGYDGILSNGQGGAYVVSASGFGDDHRARCRTPLLAHPARALVEPVQTELGRAGHWMATGDAITLLPTSELLSSLPQVRPVQLLVRTAAADGVPSSGQGPVEVPNDWVAFLGPIPAAAVDLPLPNEPVSAGLQCAHWDIACGTCWSGDDVSPGISPLLGPERAPQPRGLLPRLDLWTAPLGAGGALGDGPRVIVAGEDPASPAAVGSACTVDDLHAGGLTHAGLAVDGHESAGGTPNAIANGIQVIWIAGQPTAQLPAAVDLRTVVVQATTPIFQPKSPGAPGMGLVRIDGEVFAYAPPTAADVADILAGWPALAAIAPQQPRPSEVQIGGGGSFARLIARGLLSDSPPSAHTIGSGTFADNPQLADGLLHTPLLAAIALPLGPVRLLDGAQANGPLGSPGAWFGLLGQAPDASQPRPWLPMPAPLALLASTDGATHEVVQLIGPHGPDGATPSLRGGFCSAPWLRGLYHTGTPQRADGADWSGAEGRMPAVVIGWWPRYPSALAADESHRAQELRSRAFAWAGFPVAVLGGYWDAVHRGRLSAPFDTLPLISVAADPDPLMQLEVRAMGAPPQPGPAHPMDWSLQAPVDIPAPGGDPTDASPACQPAADGTHSLSDGRTALPSDGIEVRVDWHYRGPTSTRYEDIAAAGNRAPTIQGVRVRYLAPVRVLATVPQE